MDLEKTIFTMIAHSGEAKSACMEAIASARHGDFNRAENFIGQANEKLLLAHECQTTLIQSEAQGSEIKLSLLMIHAQDHLMNTVTVKDLAGEFIEMYRAVYKK